MDQINELEQGESGEVLTDFVRCLSSLKLVENQSPSISSSGLDLATARYKSSAVLTSSRIVGRRWVLARFLYKSALDNVFEVDKWRTIEYCTMAKHFERQGKSPYAYHAVRWLGVERMMGWNVRWRECVLAMIRAVKCVVAVGHELMVIYDCREKVISVLVKAMKNSRSTVCKTSIMALSDVFGAYGNKLLQLDGESDGFDQLVRFYTILYVLPDHVGFSPAEHHHSPESTGSDLDTTSLSFNSIVVVAGIPRSTTSSSSETTTTSWTTSSSTFSCKSHSDSPHWNAVFKSVPSLSFSGDIGAVYLAEIKSAEGVHFAAKMMGLGWVSMEFIGACRIDWGNGIDGIGFGFRSGCRSGCRHGGMGSMGLGEWEAVAAVMDELAVVDRS
ncbi:hypothetical protein Droror1_Dr00027338 [Drosera rotundifolia]